MSKRNKAEGRSNSLDPNSSGRSKQIMLAILLLALAFKSFYLAAYVGESPFYLAPASDSEVYVLQTFEMSEEGLLGDDVFYRAPLYPYFLYGVFVLSDFQPLPLHIVQLVMGLCILALLYSIGARIASERAGWVAALIGLAYAPMTFYETKILATVPGMLLGLLFVHFLVRAEQEGQRRDWILGGVALGGAILCRPHFLLVFPIALFLWGIRHRANLRPVVAPLVSFSLVVAGLIAVVTLRNYVVSGDLVPISANSGVTFAQGNAPGARGSLTPIEGLSDDVSMQHINSKRLAESVLGRELSPSEVNRYWVGRGLEFIFDDPGRYALLLIRKLALMANNQELASNYLVDIDLKMFPLLRLAFLPFGLILGWACLGGVILVRDKRLPVIVSAAVLGTVGTMLVFYVTTRYRMSLAPVAMVLAGVGIDRFVSQWGDRKQILQSACIVLAVFVLSLPPFLPFEKKGLDRNTATSWANLAVVFHMGDRIPEAAEAISRATSLAPNEASFQMMQFDFLLLPGFTTARQEFDEAQKLVRAFPAHPGGYRRTAEALVKQARPREAIAQYELAIGREPAEVHSMWGLAQALLEIGHRQRAKQVLEQLLRIAPLHEGAKELLARLR